jgi:predicted CxxxxCH...CXXCH cytochrome family protein
MERSPNRIVLLLPLAALLACTPSSDSDGSDCTSCHQTTALATGAHAAHLSAGPLAKAAACTECHVVPTDSGHAGKAVAVTFATGSGDLANKGGAAPVWSSGARTCSGVYCHGATLSGGSNVAPAWAGGSSQAQCGTCHGNPPTANGHPQVALQYCSGCHPSTMKADGTLDVSKGKHVDGVIESEAFSHASTWSADHQAAAAADHAAGCKPCHGGDLKGGTSGVSCWTCHPQGPPI